MFDRLDIEYWDLRPSELAEFTDTLDPEIFMRVSTTRERRPPMVSPVFTDWAPLMLIVKAVAAALAAELTKESYQLSRKALLKLMARSKEIVTPQGSQNIFIFRVEQEQGHVDFVFTAVPDEQQFLIALSAIPGLTNELPQEQFTALEFDPQSGRWKQSAVADEWVTKQLRRSRQKKRP